MTGIAFDTGSYTKLEGFSYDTSTVYEISDGNYAYYAFMIEDGKFLPFHLIGEVHPANVGKPTKYEIHAHEYEMQRQAEACENITASPVACSQLFLNYGSRPMWIRGKDGKMVYHKSRVVWNEDKTGKILLMTLTEEEDDVDLRYAESVLKTLEDSGITDVIVRHLDGTPYFSYTVEELRALREKWNLGAEDVLIINGTIEGVPEESGHEGAIKQLTEEAPEK